MSKQYIGGQLMYNSDIVVGQEIKTGGTYNGDPVYCYCNIITGKESASVGSYTAVTGATLSNVREKIGLEGFLQVTPTGWGGSPLPYLYTNGSGAITRHYELWYDGNTIKANLKGGGSAIDIKIIYYAFYTKTTD